MSQYSTGTVTVVPASATITGSGTEWLSTIKVNNIFKSPSHTEYYVVSAVVSNTELRLTALYGGGFPVAGGAYTIFQDFTPLKGLPLMQKGDLESVALFNALALVVDLI